MGIALFTAVRLLAPLQTFLSNCVTSASRQRQRDAPANASCERSKLLSPTSSAGATRPRPLRVVRVPDGVQGSDAVGRMVISGCMADVCAELDRLAAKENLGSELSVSGTGTLQEI